MIIAEPRPMTKKHLFPTFGDVVIYFCLDRLG